MSTHTTYETEVELAELRRKVWPMDLAFYARAAFRSRFDLLVETSIGGYRLEGSYPTEKEAEEKGKKLRRKHRTYDSFKSARPELLAAFTRYLEITDPDELG